MLSCSIARFDFVDIEITLMADGQFAQKENML
jgi:hypothetical protein